MKFAINIVIVIVLCAYQCECTPDDAQCNGDRDEYDDGDDDPAPNGGYQSCTPCNWDVAPSETLNSGKMTGAKPPDVRCLTAGDISQHSEDRDIEPYGNTCFGIQDPFFRANQSQLLSDAGNDQGDIAYERSYDPLDNYYTDQATGGGYIFQPNSRLHNGVVAYDDIASTPHPGGGPGPAGTTGSEPPSMEYSGTQDLNFYIGAPHVVGDHPGVGGHIDPYRPTIIPKDSTGMRATPHVDDFLKPYSTHDDEDHRGENEVEKTLDGYYYKAPEATGEGWTDGASGMDDDQAHFWHEGDALNQSCYKIHNDALDADYITGKRCRKSPAYNNFIADRSVGTDATTAARAALPQNQGGQTIDLSNIVNNCDISTDEDCIDEGQNPYTSDNVYERDNWSVLHTRRFSPIQGFLYDGGMDTPTVAQDGIPLRNMSSPYSKLGTMYKMDGTIRTISGL